MKLKAAAKFADTVTIKNHHTNLKGQSMRESANLFSQARRIKIGIVVGQVLPFLGYSQSGYHILSVALDQEVKRK